MKTFIYYSKTDSKKEILDKTIADRIEIATYRFAQRKKLPVSSFLSLFTVKEYEEEEN